MPSRTFCIFSTHLSVALSNKNIINHPNRNVYMLVSSWLGIHVCHLLVTRWLVQLQASYLYSIKEGKTPGVPVYFIRRANVSQEPSSEFPLNVSLVH